MNSTMDDDEEIPAEVRDYLAVDLGEDSPAARDLFARLPHEKVNGREPIKLTDGVPQGVTPEMGVWFNKFVAGKRNAAIAAVCARFSADRFRDGSTVLVEHEADRIAATTAQRKALTRNEFENSDGAKELMRKAREARQDFSFALQDQGGRQPRMFPPVLYFGGLVLILCLEIPINLESFLQWMHTPLFAGAATLVTAILVGFASHLHGTILRQHYYYFGPRDRVRWYQGAKQLAGGAVLLSGALVLAGYARYALIERQTAIVILVGGAPPRMLGTLIAMLASNVGVYLVGATWAYLTHDEIPDYPSKKRRADREQARFEAAFSRQVADEFSRLDRSADDELENLSRLERTQQTAAGYARNRKLFAMVRAKDDDVVARLLDYRAAIARANDQARFAYSDHTLAVEDRDTELSAGEWAARAMRLSYYSGSAE